LKGHVKNDGSYDKASRKSNAESQQWVIRADFGLSASRPVYPG
jgi:hypothetical protein